LRRLAQRCAFPTTSIQINDAAGVAGEMRVLIHSLPDLINIPYQLDFESLAELKRNVMGFKVRYQRAAKPFKWTFTRRDP
jgi:hypothetical protein